MYYGVEKYSCYDRPQSQTRRFFRKDLALEWLDGQGRQAFIDEQGRSYPSFKSLYEMPWYWRPPLKSRALAYLEENNPLMKYYWGLEDIRAEVISKVGGPVRL
jgi:hypothetical protein